jgi:hypothetical protein
VGVIPTQMPGGIPTRVQGKIRLIASAVKKSEAWLRARGEVIADLFRGVTKKGVRTMYILRTVGPLSCRSSFHQSPDLSVTTVTASHSWAYEFHQQ